MFKDKKELAQALLDGRRFTTPQGGTLYFDPTAEGSPFRYMAPQKDGTKPQSETMHAGWNTYGEVVEHIEPITVWVNIGPDGWVRIFRKKQDALDSSLPTARRAIEMQLVTKS